MTVSFLQNFQDTTPFEVTPAFPDWFLIGRQVWVD